MTGKGWRFGRLGALCLIVLGLLCSSAAANHSFKDQISIGPTGGNGAVNSFFEGSSQDGVTAVFSTTESLVAGDTDTATDLYQRVGNTTTLVSIGPSGGNGANDAFFDAISDDGSRILFDTDERLVPADTDSSFDTYERSNGVTTLVTTGPGGGNGAFDVFFDGASRDGTHVFFETDESLVAADIDSSIDVYERTGGQTTLVSTGPAGGNGAFIPSFAGNSDDGSHVFFETDESLVAADTDSSIDVYDRSGGQTTLVSTGPAGGNGALAARFAGSSQNGARVFFETQESLVAADTDSQNDVYERSGGTTSLVSTGPNGGNGLSPALFDGSSGDGTHVFFHTSESLVAADTDARTDVYERTGGTTQLVSTGPAGGNGALDVFFDGSSLDGNRVFFDTAESLVTADTDTRADVYERVSGTTTNRLSTGTNGGNGAFDAFFQGASQDGSRVFFTTGEAVEATDTDTATDLYERWNGTTTHISIGPNGGNGAFTAFWDGSSADASRVFFDTKESLISTDTDAVRDIYAATLPSYPRPKGATPIRTTLAIAYQPCTSGNSTHGTPLSFPSCSPPIQASGQLTVGTPDSNGQASKAVGFVRYGTIVGDPGTPANEADVTVTASMTDVRLKSTLADYTGQLQLNTTAQVTDRQNGASGTAPATGSNVGFPVTVPCVTTADTTVGSTCSVSTTFNAVVPGAIVESKRAIWELGKASLFDGGPDGVASTAPNTLFATQGIFVP